MGNQAGRLPADGLGGRVCWRDLYVWAVLWPAGVSRAADGLGQWMDGPSRERADAEKRIEADTGAGPEITVQSHPDRGQVVATQNDLLEVKK